MTTSRFMKGTLLLLAAVLVVACQKSGSDALQNPAATKLLHHYFESWSAKQMDAYGNCFDDAARIYFIGKDEKVVAQAKIDFVHEQRVLQDEAVEPMKEVPLDIKLQGDDKVLQAAVTWVLTQGAREVRGTDFFTLRKVSGEWKILSLAFYGQ